MTSTMSPLAQVIEEAVAALILIVQFHGEVFVYGRPLCIEGKPIDHTTLNEAAKIAQQALRKIKRMQND